MQKTFQKLDYHNYLDNYGTTKERQLYLPFVDDKYFGFSIKIQVSTNISTFTTPTLIPVFFVRITAPDGVVILEASASNKHLWTMLDDSFDLVYGNDILKYNQIDFTWLLNNKAYTDLIMQPLLYCDTFTRIFKPENKLTGDLDVKEAYTHITNFMYMNEQLKERKNHIPFKPVEKVDEWTDRSDWELGLGRKKNPPGY